MDNFLITALLVGGALSFITGPIGCFVIWNRLSYLGDAIAHASFLGIILSLLMNINVFWGNFVVTILVLLIFINCSSNKYSIETILAVFSYIALSGALLIYSLTTTISINIESILFGDILASSMEDFIIISSFTVFALLWLKKNWDSLLLMTINYEIAQSNNIDCHKLKLKLLALIASLVILSIKIVGIILISSLIVIPASSSRILAKSPETMAIGASLFSLISVILGLFLSNIIDTPSGPSIIIVSGAIFLVAHLKLRFSR
jgi:zinc transport system permease protein